MIHIKKHIFAGILYCIVILTFTIDLFAGKTILLFSFSVTLANLIIVHLFFIRMPMCYYITILIFSFGAQYFGLMFGFYGKFGWFDLLLHFLSGLLLSPIGLFFLSVLLKKESPPLGLSIVFCFLFSTAAASVWEIYEYVGDVLFSLDSQGGSLVDTMEDIITGTIGGGISTLVIFFRLKKKKQN